MLNAGELTASARFLLKDMQGVRWSDFEILEGLNRAGVLLFTRMADRFVYAGIRRTFLIAEDRGVTLPRDFSRLHKLRTEDGTECVPVPRFPAGGGEYRIAGDVLEVPAGGYVMEYWRVPPRMADVSDGLDAPEAVRDYLVQAAAALLTGEVREAESVVRACCRSLAGGQISGFEDEGPPVVWGGIA